MLKLISVIKEFKALFSIFTFFIIVIAVFLSYNKQKQENLNLELTKKSYDAQYEITYENFKNISQNTYYGILNKPFIYRYFEKYTDTNRKKLYEKFLSDYNRLKSFDILQVHFHTKNNISFLRMHAPEKFGDDLTDIRESVFLTNKHLKPIEGFEMGKIIHGFRFTYPMFDEKLEHLGSVEVSISSNYFEKTYEKNFNADLHFLVTKSIAKKKMFPKELKRFKESYENDSYVFYEEDERIHFPHQNYFNKDEKALIKKNMKEAKNFVIKKGGTNTIIYFKPVKNVSNIKNAAYMVIYSESKYLSLLNKSYNIIFLTLILIYIIFIFLIYNKYENIQKNRRQKEFFNQQTKLASIGELINNIAHQWRQPLSVISTSASGLKLQKEYGILEDKSFNEAMDIIVEQSQSLSRTIDEFRNYTSTSKKIEPFNSEKIFKYPLSLFENDINSKHLNIIKNIEDLELISYEEDIIQVVTILLKNAIDFSNKNGLILLSLKQKKTDIIIQIQDSAGGIDKNKLSKIFEPYFTTKHKTLGKGLALYTAYEIVNNSLNGTLKAENTNFSYKFKTHKGALFTIKIKKDYSETKH